MLADVAVGRAVLTEKELLERGGCSESYLPWRLLVYSCAAAEFFLETKLYRVERLGRNMDWRVGVCSSRVRGISDASYDIVLACLRQYMASSSVAKVVAVLSLGRTRRILVALGCDENALEPIDDLDFDFKHAVFADLLGLCMYFYGKTEAGHNDYEIRPVESSLWESIPMHV